MSNTNLLENHINKKGFNRRFIEAFLKYWQIYLLILPGFIYLLIFYYGPMYGLQIAFKDFRTSLGIWGSEWVGFKHFIRFIEYPNFWKIVRNTFIISLYTLATFPLTPLLALLINEIRNKYFKKTVQMITYAPHFISIVVLCGMIMLFLDKERGIANNLMATLGLEKMDFMIKPEWFSTIYVWSGVWQGIGWGTIIYLAVLSNVSPEQIEAAKIDGANRIQIIRHVNFPTIMPTVIIMFILRCGHVLSVGFEKIYLLQNDLNLDTSQVISTYVYRIGILAGQFSYSAAIGLFNTLVNFSIILLVNYVANKKSGFGLF